MLIAEAVFWLALLILFTVYFGYPLGLALAAAVFGKRTAVISKTDFYPEVALVISVYNEEQVLEEKIKNSLAQDYPQDKYKVIVVSDGSSDGTDRIVSEFDNQRLRLFRVAERKGKTHGLNLVMAELEEEIVVFSDANSLFKADAIKNLVRPFADEVVGGVCGELKYRVDRGSGALSEGLYWRYETWIKRSEGKLSKVIVFNGSIYAMRRKLHQPMNVEAANDFQHPVQILLQGYQNRYEANAVAYEERKENDRAEFGRHVRITLRGWKGLSSYLDIINPFKVGFTGFHFFLRKPLRWLSPFLLLILMVTNILLLTSQYYQVLFALQVLLYLLALPGYLFNRKGIKTILNPVYYFCLTNYALLVAFIYFILNQSSATWTPTSHFK